MITAELREGTAVTLRARGFSWASDEPIAAGGTDTGPDPYELLLGGLASCIAVTLRLYADHKGIGLTGVDVRLDFERVHADDCEGCVGRPEEAQKRPASLLGNGWLRRLRKALDSATLGSADGTVRPRLLPR